MSFRWFVVPALRPGPPTGELNDFLAEVRVLSVQRGLIQDAGASFWSVCVEFEDDAESLPERLRAGARRTAGSTTVDYKAVLSADEFARFAALREWRKEVAQREGIPVYNVFNNEHLAEIARKRISSRAGLESIDGIGAARLAKFGDAVIRFLTAQANAIAPTADEAKS
jgi:superfamily II DNA helicase RecQ